MTITAHPNFTAAAPWAGRHRSGPRPQPQMQPILTSAVSTGPFTPSQCCLAREQAGGLAPTSTLAGRSAALCVLAHRPFNPRPASQRKASTGGAGSAPRAGARAGSVPRAGAAGRCAGRIGEAGLIGA